MYVSVKAGLAALSLSLLLNTGAAAQPVTIVVGYTAGASYDIYARNFARHLGKHLPGNPNVIVQNMTGAGSLRSANYIFNQAPKDGSTVGVFARGLAMQPLLDPTGIQYEPLKFNWVGSLSSDVSLVLSWHTRPFKTIDDLRKTEMVVAGTGSGADSVIFPYILNGVLGTKMKIVTGYPGAADFLLAVERQEADGTAGVSWSGLNAARPEWIANKRINIIVQLGLKKHPAMGAAPLVTEFAKNDSDRGVLELIFSRQDMGYPVVAPPGVPPERLAVLRKAFEATMRDPEYIADGKKQHLEAAFMRGEEIEALIKRVNASPKDVIDRAVRALEAGKGVTTEKPGSKK
jgi:tripartite-type tricarboxylate transporter receptor subunit TctC